MTNDPIQILVVLHAILRNLVIDTDTGILTVHMPAGSRVADVLTRLNLPKMDVVYSLNSLIVDETAALKDGDRVDVIPAISGGSRI